MSFNDAINGAQKALIAVFGETWQIEGVPVKAIKSQREISHAAGWGVATVLSVLEEDAININVDDSALGPSGESMRVSSVSPPIDKVVDVYIGNIGG